MPHPACTQIRGTLTRLEDTIIFRKSLPPPDSLLLWSLTTTYARTPLPVLIERASFAHNPRIYDPKGFADLGLESSWIDWLLRETETVHGAEPRSASETSNVHPLT